MNLLPKLRSVADLWVAAHQRTDGSVSVKTLGVRSVANSKLFDRPGMGVSTFETVAYWLAKPANWPAGVIPPEAAAILSGWDIFVPVDALAKLPVAA